MKHTRIVLAVALLAACKGAEKKETPAPPPAAPPAPAVPTRVATVEGLLTPESVLWDARQDVYFVSNVNGGALAKDNNGFISRLTPDGQVATLKFIAGGAHGVTLNAPKGLALHGDTLWVTDIDALRAFNASTGAPIASVAVKGAVFLNDPAFAPDGDLYFTDTGIRFDAAGNATHPGTDRVYRLGRDRKVTVALQEGLQWPNGIAWDSVTSRFVIVSFGGPTVWGWRPGDPEASELVAGQGSFDGVVVVNAHYLVSSWKDSSVTDFYNDVGTPLITGVESPADIGYDASRNRLLIPVFTGNRVEIWQLPQIGAEQEATAE